MSAALPQVAAIVVTFNSARHLPGLLDSLPAGLEGLTWRLVVVDNDSSDDTIALCRRLSPDAQIVRTGRNAGYAAGINAGMAAADADAYLLMNPDVRLGEGCVATLLASLGPGTGIAVPRLTDAHDELIWSQRREPTLARAWADAVLGAQRAGRIGTLGEVVTDSDRYLRPSATDWAEGSVQLISDACARACGSWDESYFLYSEETDFHLLARDVGLGVRYVPNAHAQHLEGDSGTAPALWSLLTANRLRRFRKRHGRAASTAYWAALVLREGTRSIRGDSIARAALRVLLSPARLRAERGPEWLAE